MKSLPLPMTIGASGVGTASVVLTPEQRAIVEADDGPVVVIAGAGTGKTRVIVERVRWLLETKAEILPEQILVLTYNVKAAKELQQRHEHIEGSVVRVSIAHKQHVGESHTTVQNGDG